MAWQCTECRTPGREGDSFCAVCGAARGPSTVLTGPLDAIVPPPPQALPYAALPDDAPVTVASERARLDTEPDVAVLIGQAPDGLPLVLEVHRRGAVEGMLRAALGARGGVASRLVPAPGASLEWLEQAIDEQARVLGILTLGDERVYRTAHTLPSLLGPTLLVQALGPASRLPDAMAGATVPPWPAARTRITGPLPPAAAGGAATPRIGDLHLTVPLQEGPVDVLQLGPFGQPVSGTRRLLLEEDLVPLPSARFHYRPAGDAEPQEGRPAEREAYWAAIRSATTLWWSVSRHDLALQIAALAKRLGKLHADGHVHADIKPANVLITWEGAVPIDPVHVPVGAVSPLATHGWAAPELLLSRPVSPATDVYALGLLVASLLQASLYGEERTFLRPGPGGSRRLHLLAVPEARIAPHTLDIDAGARAAWESFIARCLAFDPAGRPADGAAAAVELQTLLERTKLPGRLAVSGGHGRLCRNVTIHGTVRTAWVLADSW